MSGCVNAFCILGIQFSTLVKVKLSARFKSE